MAFIGKRIANIYMFKINNRSTGNMFKVKV